MDLDKEVFKGKKLSDIVKEVYEKHKNQENKISGEIERLSELISSPGDAIIIVPLLKGFFDSSLKNDEVLMKILQLFQKAAEKSQSNEADSGILSEKDIEQLFNEVNSIGLKETKKLN
jgi:ferritin